MLVTVKEVLEAAAKGSYAVVIYRANHSTEVASAIKAAEEMKAPVILERRPDPVAVTECFPAYMKWVQACAEAASVPVALGYECDSLEDDYKMIAATGATFVSQYEGPKQPAINEDMLSDALDKAHNAGLCLSTKIGKKNAPATPEHAVRLLRESGLDILALELNLEGPEGKTFDFDRFEAIKAAMDGKTVPYILHGCQGFPPEDLRKACATGISALNISKDCWVAVRDKVQEENWDPYASCLKGAYEKLKELIELSGSAGKG